MKKIVLLLVLLLTPLTVLAANPKVTKLSAQLEDNVVTYQGEMESGSYAVMCKLYSGEVEIDMKSVSVSNKKFEGTFKVTEKADYKLSCANWEGGEILSSDVKIVNVVEVPNTNDNVMGYVTLGSISFIGLIVFLKKEVR